MFFLKCNASVKFSKSLTISISCCCFCCRRLELWCHCHHCNRNDARCDALLVHIIHESLTATTTAATVTIYSIRSIIFCLSLIWFFVQRNAPWHPGVEISVQKTALTAHLSEGFVTNHVLTDKPQNASLARLHEPSCCRIYLAHEAAANIVELEEWQRAGMRTSLPGRESVKDEMQNYTRVITTACRVLHHRCHLQLASCTRTTFSGSSSGSVSCSISGNRQNVQLLHFTKRRPDSTLFPLY